LQGLGPGGDARPQLFQPQATVVVDDRDDGGGGSVVEDPMQRTIDRLPAEAPSNRFNGSAANKAMCQAVLDTLVDIKFLRLNPDGTYARLADGPGVRSRVAPADVRATCPPGFMNAQTCPRCDQMSGLPVAAIRASFECLDCGHVWREGKQESPERFDRL